jgi:hypothetical protein
MSVGDIKPLLSRFPKGGWRTKAARTHSTSMVRGGHGRCQGWYPPGSIRRTRAPSGAGQGHAAAPGPPQPSEGLVPFVEISRKRLGGHGGGTARRAGSERLGHALGGEDLADGERVFDRGDHAHWPPTVRAGQDVDRKRSAHEGCPGPVAGRGREDLPGFGGAKDCGFGCRPTIAHDLGTPVRMGSRSILPRERRWSPFTTAGTPCTARSHASDAVSRAVPARCYFASCRTGRRAPCPRG